MISRAELLSISRLSFFLRSISRSFRKSAPLSHNKSKAKKIACHLAAFAGAYLRQSADLLGSRAVFKVRDHAAIRTLFVTLEPLFEIHSVFEASEQNLTKSDAADGISRDSACESSTIANVKSLFKLEFRKLTAWFDFAAEPKNSLNKVAGRQCSSARAPFELICRRYPCKRSVGVLSLSNTATSMPDCFRPCARQRPPVPAPTIITFDSINTSPLLEDSPCRLVSTF
jgi:hypothetical protein